jgi:hypothetical protein
VEDEQADGVVHGALRVAEPGGSERLAGTLIRYGEAIEYDLACRGVDLAQEWRSRRWRKLLNLIDHLPAHSAYAEALAADEDLAELILSQPRPEGAAVVRISEWSSERAVLAEISDKLSSVVAAVIAAAGSKPPPFVPSPRPKVAADRIRERQRVEAHLSLVDRLIPDRAQAEADFQRLAAQDE